MTETDAPALFLAGLMLVEPGGPRLGQANRAA
jgi:hypothetical protein